MTVDYLNRMPWKINAIVIHRDALAQIYSPVAGGVSEVDHEGSACQLAGFGVCVVTREGINHAPIRDAHAPSSGHPHE